MFRRLLQSVCICSLIMLTGCGITQETPEKIRDLDFTVVEADEEPQALVEIISEKKEEPFQMSYTLGEDLYIVVGYGEQESGGYSIQVNECYETDSSIFVDTTLLGPDSQEEMANTVTYPYIVIKTESIPDKMIEFQ